MTVTETTSTSWTSRLGDSFKGIVGGLVLIVASVCILFWNEGRTLHRYQDLEGAAGACVPVKCDSVDPANDGKPVYMNGEMKTEEILSDPIFPAVTINALRLNRTVEMYQWEEEERSQTRKKLGGGEETVTTYSYKKVWSEEPIDSGRFKEVGHDNPAMDLRSEEISAQVATLGAFDASALIPLKNDDTQFVVKPAEKKVEEAAPEEAAAPAEVKAEEKVEEATPEEAVAPAEEKPVESTATAGTVAVTPAGGEAEKKVEVEDPEKAGEAVLAQLDAEEKAEAAAPAEAEDDEATLPDVKLDEEVPVKAETKAEEKDVNLPEGFQYFNGGYYRGKNPGAAEVGDMRISFSYVPNGNVSVIAGQQDNQLISWQSTHGTVMLLQTGTVSQDTMFANARSANRTIGWLLRAAGVILMFIGFNMVFKPLSVIADVIPLIGNLVEGATGIVAFILTLSGSCLTIGIAWLYYRPLIGLPLVAISIALLVWLFMRGKKQ